MAQSYDVVVIGSGPGGYVCAIKAAQLGLRTAIVEKRATLGGTCLNVGCIPSKALLHASEKFHEASHELEAFGVKVGKPKLDLKVMMAHKDAVVKANVDGVAFLMKKNGIGVHNGIATIEAPGKVRITGNDDDMVLEAGNIVIATGSDIAGIPGIDVEIDEKTIVSSTGALSLDGPPKRLVVVGGGYIGVEMGSVWNRLGAEVTVVEYLEKILGAMDGEVSKLAQRVLSRQGMSFKLGSKVTAVERTGKGAKVSFEPAKGGDAESLEADVVLISTGRRPYSEGLGLEKIGVEMERGKVKTDGMLRTSVEGIYAIGDVTSGPMLAHKAEDEGVAVAERIAGQSGHVNYDAIPGVVYTQPEIASVGKSEEELKEAGIDYAKGKFMFSANARARAMNIKDGFVKVLADKKTDRVLGVHIIGHTAGEMIHEGAILMEFSGSSEDLARTCHAHPTLSEAVKEAALACFAKPIHS
jgi:dihydrolipoamide dehydrogenase